MKFNRSLVCERLSDLRHPNGKTIPLNQLHDGILKKTGVSISATQLSKYEDTDKTDIMNVKNLIAIADYYNVSYDYLLGYSRSPHREHHDFAALTDLTPESIERFVDLCNMKFWPKSDRSSSGHVLKANFLINVILCQSKIPDLIRSIISLFISFLDWKANSANQNQSIITSEDIDLTELNDNYEYKLWRLQNCFHEIIVGALNEIYNSNKDDRNSIDAILKYSTNEKLLIMLEDKNIMNAQYSSSDHKRLKEFPKKKLSELKKTIE